ncbi:DUF4162 domain-containing protein, partial [Lactobacillus sp. XV13L]|nr:DUF4162 domain-containing protein [Lactobacillus sp. XV13L]
LLMLKNGHVVLNGELETVRNSFGKTQIYVKTPKTQEQLQQLPHVQSVIHQKGQEYLLQIADETHGPEVFAALTNGHYIEEFRQQPPTLDEIFRMEAGADNE